MINNNLKLTICKSNNETINLSNNVYDTLVLGNKFTGKSSVVLKSLAYQTILNKNVGALFVTSTKDLSYEIYTLAKQHKRRILYINPSTDNDVDLGIKNKEFKHLESTYDFEKLIFSNYIVIVDVELMKTKDNGIQFVDFLILKLEKSLYNNESIYHKPFILFIDDAFNYLDSLSNIIYYGNQYNISNILFFQNRHQFKTKSKDYSAFLESNISNLILMNNINYEDIKYYEDVFNLDISNKLVKKGDIFYSLKDLNGATLNNFGEFEYNSIIDIVINKKINSIKRSLKKKKSNTNINVNTDFNSNSSINTNVESLINKKEEIQTTSSEGTDSIDLKQYNRLDLNGEKSIRDNSDATDNSNKQLKDINKTDKDTILKVNDSKPKVNNELSFSKSSNKIELILDWDDDDF